MIYILYDAILYEDNNFGIKEVAIRHGVRLVHKDRRLKGRSKNDERIFQPV